MWTKEDGKTSWTWKGTTLRSDYGDKNIKKSKWFNKMPSRFAAVTNQEISLLINQVIPKVHKEGDEVRFGSFNW